MIASFIGGLVAGVALTALALYSYIQMGYNKVDRESRRDKIEQPEHHL